MHVKRRLREELERFTKETNVIKSLKLDSASNKPQASQRYGDEIFTPPKGNKKISENSLLSEKNIACRNEREI